MVGSNLLADKSFVFEVGINDEPVVLGRYSLLFLGDGTHKLSDVMDFLLHCDL